VSDFSLILSVFRRHKLRTLFTILSVAVAFAIFIVLSTLYYGFAGLVNYAQAQRIVIWPESGASLPVSYAAKIASLSQVKAVAYLNGIFGHYRDPKNGVFVQGVPFAQYEIVFPENTISDVERRAMQGDRKCAIASAPLIKKYGWKIGETIPLEGAAPQVGGSTTWYFRICGVFKSSLPDSLNQNLVAHYDYLNDGRADTAGKDTVSQIFVMADDARHVPGVARAIEATFAGSQPTVMATPDMLLYASVMKAFGDVGAILTAVGAAVFFSMLLVTGNAMSNSVRQRIAEFALMRALGFSRRRLAWLVLWESTLVIGLGTAIGVPLGAKLCDTMSPFVDRILPYFFVTWQNVATALALAVLFSLLTGVLPARRVTTLAVADTLRRH
jgi:putative ABC transport system permease protein